jgi:hypothetical protein
MFVAFLGSPLLVVEHVQSLRLSNHLTWSENYTSEYENGARFSDEKNPTLCPRSEQFEQFLWVKAVSDFARTISSMTSTVPSGSSVS